MKKYHIITFGCQMNKADSERIAASLERKGYKPSPNIGDADLIVVNMCSVRQAAVDRVYGLVPNFKKLKNKKPHLKTVLTGCITRMDRKKLAEKFDLIADKEKYLTCPPKYSDKLLAYVAISNGCNNACSYCVVPFTRGRLVCRDHREILKETKKAIARGAREIWLLGQNVNDYHSPVDSSFNFAKLLRTINDISGNFKLFFTSPHPKNFSDELINTLAKCEKFGKLLNLPVQSGDNEILKKMNRNYTVEEYKKLVRKIKKKIPDIILSTDVIVGFPGETKKQFQNTVKLFNEIGFNYAYIAKYSPRPETYALSLKDNISLSEKRRREKILRDILNRTRYFKQNKV